MRSEIDQDPDRVAQNLWSKSLAHSIILAALWITLQRRVHRSVLMYEDRHCEADHQGNGSNWQYTVITVHCCRIYVLHIQRVYRGFLLLLPSSSIC